MEDEEEVVDVVVLMAKDFHAVLRESTILMKSDPLLHIWLGRAKDWKGVKEIKQYGSRFSNFLFIAHEGGGEMSKKWVDYFVEKYPDSKYVKRERKSDYV